MVKIILPLVLAAIAVLTPFIGGSTALAGEIPWNDYQKGMNLARSGGKNVVIAFFSEDCGYCKLMARETFQDRVVVDMMTRDFVPILVDADVEKGLSEEYPSPGLPTVWFLDPAGKKIAPLIGYQPPGFFTAVLKYIKSGSYRKMTFQDFVDQGLYKQ